MNANWKKASCIILLSLVLLISINSADDCGCGSTTPADSSDVTSGYGSSEDPVIHLNRAREYLSRNELVMAMAECKESLTLDPNSIQALLLEGEILFQMGNHREAAATFQKVTQMYPSEEEAYKRLGNTYLLLGEYRAAEEAYTHSLAIRPGDPVVQGNLEKVRRLAGQGNQTLLNETSVKDNGTEIAQVTPPGSPVITNNMPVREIETSLSSSYPTTAISPVLFPIAFLIITFIIRIKICKSLFSP